VICAAGCPQCQSVANVLNGLPRVQGEDRLLRTRSNLVTERAGINFVRGIVEDAGCLFKEVNLQHDFGHDATIVLVADGEVQPREVALQIKSGASYAGEAACHIPASVGHIDFWARHDLITLGVVFEPDRAIAHWVDLQAECRARKKHSVAGGATLSFRKEVWNRFDASNFVNFLVPTILGNAPTLPIATALDWAVSADFTTHDLGVRTLLARYKDEAETWACLLTAFRGRATDLLSLNVPVAFARLLGHCDIGDYSGQIPPEIRQPAEELILSFGASEFTRLLSMLPDDESFDQGSFGYALLPLLGAHAESQKILQSLCDDAAVEAEVRSKAAFLVSWYEHDPDWWRCWRRPI